ncbi:Diadenosine tetraphosphate (Ap4A) hydrolase and other HIT family hydrolases-like protein [candidate division TM7 genomosp. GTL1]|nr:Diadenosine tetraphosphate (Ap4A) hydrolase and other HIT family hydrolases-like protein [candidate division TM7 genomosp. GTL1]
MNNCLSCQLLKTIEERQIIFSGGFWQIELQHDQQYLGKSVVTLKRHASSLRELTNEEGREFFEIIKRFEMSVIKNFHPTHFNWSCLMNDAAGVGMPMHVHWHAIPRYKEVKQFRGHEFIDQRWPKSARDIEQNEPSDEVLWAIRNVLKADFNAAY